MAGKLTVGQREAIAKTWLTAGRTFGALTLDVRLRDLEGWSPEQVHAFYAGLALVTAAGRAALASTREGG
jgi:hypothetical protein